MPARRRLRRPPPLPVRDGLGPARVRVPRDAHGLAVVDVLTAAYPDRDWAAHAACNELVDVTGRSARDGARWRAGDFAYHPRTPAPETPVPFTVDELDRRDGVLVVDKPHFLATVPRGAHVTESVVVRLRRDPTLRDVVPAHRLDRATAGVLLCTYDPALRAPYQQLFERRAVVKVYEALAPVRDDLTFPLTVRNRIDKRPGDHVAHVVDGAPNAETHIELLARHGRLGRYRLVPRTGRTHQLRVHLAGLGIPIVGEDRYRADGGHTAPGRDVLTHPLRLLARSLEFDDPVTGEHRRYESRRTLTLPPGPGDAETEVGRVREAGCPRGR